MIDTESVLKFHHVTGGFPPIADASIILEDAAAVTRVHHGDTNIVQLLGAAFVHGVQILNALSFQPVRNLIDASDLWLVCLGNFQHILNVVEVGMSNENSI